MGPDPIRDDCHTAHRPHAGIWCDEPARTGSCSHDSDDRDGGNVVYRHQLRQDGSSLSQRRFRIHVCWLRDTPRAGIRHRLEHGDGLHAQSNYLHNSLQQVCVEFCSGNPLSRVGRLFSVFVHWAQSVRHSNLGADQRNDGGGHGNRDRHLPGHGRSLCDAHEHATPGPGILHAAFL